MNMEPWIGGNLCNNPRILVLGESHYDENNIGEKVSFPTAGVVRHYFEAREKWSQFFDKMAASFGYDKENARDFYEQICFGNYVDVVCGIGDNNAKHFIHLNRASYNDDWFGFVNSNEIDVIICFSKLVYNNLPGLNEAYPEEKCDKFYVGQIGGRGNYIELCNYLPNIDHPSCSVRLNKPLMVYGIRHPSSQGGYNPEQVLQFMKGQSGVSKLCFRNPIVIPTNNMAQPVELRIAATPTSPVVLTQSPSPTPPVVPTSVAKETERPKYGETKPSFLKTPLVDGQYILRLMLPLLVTIALCYYGIEKKAYLVLLIAIIPIIIMLKGIKALSNRCPKCRAWDSWYIADQKLLNKDRVKVRRPLGSAYFRSTGRTTVGIRQTFVSAEEKTYETVIKCRVCGYETKTIRSVVDDKIRR